MKQPGNPDETSDEVRTLSDVFLMRVLPCQSNTAHKKSRPANKAAIKK